MAAIFAAQLATRNKEWKQWLQTLLLVTDIAMVPLKDARKPKPHRGITLSAIRKRDSSWT
jgi:hypothetical protein